MPKRLDVIKALLIKADTVADVGCDHGRIAEYCSKSGLFKSVIASDISEQCLSKAERLIGDSDNVKYVCCDGLGFDCDEAVIAGMGGLLICSILENAKSLPNTLILGPHRDCYAVRKTLVKLGYGIDKDIDVVERGKYYSVIRAIMGGGRKDLTELELTFGADCDKQSDALESKLTKLYNTYMRAPEANSERILQIKAVMRLQGMTVPD